MRFELTYLEFPIDSIVSLTRLRYLLGLTTSSSRYTPIKTGEEVDGLCHHPSQPVYTMMTSGRLLRPSPYKFL